MGTFCTPRNLQCPVAVFPLAPWAGSRETNLDVFPDSEIGGGGGGDGVNGLLPRTFGAFPPSSRARLAHSGIAPNPIRTRFNLRRRRHALNFNFAQMGIGYREGRGRGGRASERILQEVRYWPPTLFVRRVCCRATKGNRPHRSAKLCTERGDDGQKRMDGCRSWSERLPSSALT